MKKYKIVSFDKSCNSEKVVKSSDNLDELESIYIELAFKEKDADGEYISYDIIDNTSSDKCICSTSFGSPTAFASVKAKYWVKETKRLERRKNKKEDVYEYRIRYLFAKKIKDDEERIININKNERLVLVETKDFVPYYYGTTDVYEELFNIFKERLG